MGWYIFAGIVGLIINSAVSMKFANLAEEKGYSGGGYFWLCFFLGTIGYCVVAALPDAQLHQEILELREQLRNMPNSEKANADPNPPAQSNSRPFYIPDTPPAPQKGWTCTCGREHPAYESSCVCGISKRDIMTKQ